MNLTPEIILFPPPSPPKGKHLQSKIIHKYIINHSAEGAGLGLEQERGYEETSALNIEKSLQSP